MENLDQLSIKHNNLKGSKYHGYMDSYEKNFKKLTEVKSVLELGVESGSSLRMWREYFPQATIYGIDQIPTCIQHTSDRIKVFIGTQQDNLFLKNTVDEIKVPLDIVIDDCGHNIDQITSSFQFLIDYLSDTALYFIEDISEYWLTILMGNIRQLISNRPDLEIIDTFKGRQGLYLITIQRKKV